MEVNYYNTEGIIIEIANKYLLNKKLREFNTNGFIQLIVNKTTKIIHRSSKIKGYQLSIFNNNEAIGDIQRESLEELIQELYNLY